MRNFVILGALALPLLIIAGTASAGPVQDFKTADADSNGILEAPEFKHFVDLQADGGSGVAKTVRAFRAYGIAFVAGGLRRRRQCVGRRTEAL